MRQYKDSDNTIRRVWNEAFSVRSYDVNFEGLSTLPALCRFMQEAALKHAAHLNMGVSHLRAKGLLWVLARQRITIHEFPRLDETITIRTEPTGNDRIFCYRDFTILDSADHCLGEACTVWFVMDQRDKTPRRPDSYFTIEFNESSKSTSPTKLKKLPNPNIADASKSLRVSYRDLDMNEHVNNVRYIEWIIDSFPLGFLRSHTLQELEINYLAEALYDNEISIGREDKKDLLFLHSLTRPVDNTEICRARTSWEIR
ncbi:MAG TPA: hypothetical protein ENO00_14055 [Deltaproteobacteria bacterium]|nr:hypothetical protein [Deltaproteobacteria bacterium]